MSEGNRVMKESPISEDKELRETVAKAFLEVWFKQLPANDGRTTILKVKTKQVDAIVEIVKSYGQKKYQEGELRGRMSEIQAISDKLVELGIPVLDYNEGHTPIGRYLEERWQQHLADTLERKEQ